MKLFSHPPLRYNHSLADIADAFRKGPLGVLAKWKLAVANANSVLIPVVHDCQG